MIRRVADLLSELSVVELYIAQLQTFNIQIAVIS